MRIFRIAAALAALLACIAGPAHAQLFRTYLSVGGNDANPCTLPQPCRLLPAALAAVQDGGEVWMLDSGNFNTGPVNVDKGVTILAVPGALGSVVGLGGHALVIQASAAVTLRNLNILRFPGTSGMFHGVFKTGEGKLVIQDSNIFGFAGASGVTVDAAGPVLIARTVIRDNAAGVVARNLADVSIVDSIIAENTGYGIMALGAAVSITRSVVRRSGEDGVFVIPSDGNPSAVLLTDTRIECAITYTLTSARGIRVAEGAALLTGATITGCGTGLALEKGTAVIARSTFTGNGVGVSVNVTDAAAYSSGNNTIVANGTNVAGALTTALTM